MVISLLQAKQQKQRNHLPKRRRAKQEGAETRTPAVSGLCLQPHDTALQTQGHRASPVARPRLLPGTLGNFPGCL